jgi:hypothetical protein
MEMVRFQELGAFAASARMAGVLLVVLVLTALGLAPPAAGQAPQAAMLSPEHPGVTAGDWTVLLSEDFETEFPGSTWKLQGDPTWGRETYRAHGGSWSGYCVGGGSRGIDPPGPYLDDMEAWMTYGPFDLSNATGAELEFHYWTQLGPDTDELFWGVSKTNFLYWGDYVEGSSGGWRQVIYDIGKEHASYLGEPEVWIGFKFESDEAGTGEGVYLDDITLRIQRSTGLPFKAYLPLAMRARRVTSATR